MIRPTVSQSIRSRRQIADLSVRAASHATRHSKSRVKSDPGRANGTPSVRTPCTGQVRRRSATVTITPSAANPTSRTSAPGRRSSRFVESDRGAVSALPPIRFPGPLPEPDVRLPPHPALHGPRGHAVVLVVVFRVVHGFAIFVPR